MNLQPAGFLECTGIQRFYIHVCLILFPVSLLVKALISAAALPDESGCISPPAGSEFRNLIDVFLWMIVATILSRMGLVFLAFKTYIPNCQWILGALKMNRVQYL